MIIVDDEVQASELLSEFCRAQGDEVATANDGRDGFEVLTAARQGNPSVYVAMITGYASIDSSGWCSRATAAS